MWSGRRRAPRRRNGPRRKQRCLPHATQRHGDWICTSTSSTSHRPPGHLCLRRGRRSSSTPMTTSMSRAWSRAMKTDRSSSPSSTPVCPPSLEELVTLGGPATTEAIATSAGPSPWTASGNVIVAGSTLGAFDGNASVGRRGHRRRQDHIADLSKLSGPTSTARRRMTSPTGSPSMPREASTSPESPATPAARVSTGRRIWATPTSS